MVTLQIYQLLANINLQVTSICLLIKIVHHLIVATGGVNLSDKTRLQFVHEFAQKDAIPQGVFVAYT